MTTAKSTKTRLENLTERYDAMPAGPARNRIHREIEGERGQWDSLIASRADAAKAQVPRVLDSVRRQRALTGATGIAPSTQSEVQKVITSRKVQDPSMSDSEFIHQKALKPHDPDVGKVWSEENAITRIGGLALIRRRLSHHERAAEWFKNAYEGLYGGMAPAVDMARIRVDTSIMVHDDGAAARVDNGRVLRDTIDQLGDIMTDRVIASVVLCIPCADYASPGPSGKPSGRAVEREVDRLLDALDRICELRGFRTKAA